MSAGIYSPGLVDWTAPAADLRDALVEAWFAFYHLQPRDSRTLAIAEAWADGELAEYLQ